MLTRARARGARHLPGGPIHRASAGDALCGQPWRVACASRCTCQEAMLRLSAPHEPARQALSVSHAQDDRIFFYTT